MNLIITAIDIIAIILLTLNAISALIFHNFHSAIGWSYGVFMYLVYLYYRKLEEKAK